MNVDRIILSTDDNPFYADFWHIAVSSWGKFFPSIPLSLAFVTDKDEADPLIGRMRSKTNVHVYRPVKDVPNGNYAKLARYFLASEFGNDICMCYDIDSIPLQSKYLDNLTASRQDGKMMAVGAEVYKGTPHEGKFPAGFFTANGYLFERLFNPTQMEYGVLLNSLRDIHEFDIKESPYNPLSVFSDESLIRALIKRNNMVEFIQHVPRNVDIRREWIDRSWWGIDVNKLMNGKYVECNMLRPFRENYGKMKDVVGYIYGNVPKLEDVV